MPKTEVNKIHIYYEILGHGHPLVLVTGLSCNLTFWQPILEELKTHFQLLIFDNRGSGRSDCPDQTFSIEDMALDTLMLIEKLGLHRPHILGHSMGGCIVQTLARNHREKVHKLILSNSPIKLNHVSILAQKFILQLFQEGCSITKQAEAILPWLFSSHFLSKEKNVIDFIYRIENDPYPQSLIGKKRQLEALLNFDSTHWYKNLKGPVLVIGGDEDLLCPRDSELLANHIEDAKFVDFHHVGHLPMTEIPREYMGILTNYLKG